jgi:CHAT domain-containing protein
MMRRLLILISFFCSLVDANEYYEYVIQPGDTLSQIIKSKNQAQEDIYLINRTLGFNPNKILAGNKLILKNYTNRSCPKGFGLIEPFNFDDLDFFDFIESCVDLKKVEKLKENLSSDEKVKLIISDDGYQDAFVLLWRYLEYDPNKIFENDKVEILCDSVKSGAIYLLDAYPDFCSVEDISYLPFDKNTKSALNFLMNETSVDDALTVNPFLLEMNLRIRFSYSLTQSAFNSNHPETNKLLETLKIIVLENMVYGKHITKDTFTSLVNMIYWSLNSGESHKEIFGTYEKFLDFACDGCSFQELIDAQWQRTGTDYQIYTMYMLFLNASSAQFTILDPIFREDWFSIRSQTTSEFNQIFAEDSSYLASYAAFLSDLGLKYSYTGDCLQAERYLVKAFEIYAQDIEKWFDQRDPYTEPLQLALCFMSKDTKNENAKKYFDLALKNSKSTKGNYFEDITNLLIQGYLNQNTSTALNSAMSLIKEVPEQYLNLTFYDDLDRLIDFIFLLELKLNTGYVDFISLKNLQDNLRTADDILDFKILNKDTQLSDLKDELLNTSSTIDKLESTLLSLSDEESSKLFSLYDYKKQITQQMFQESKQLNSLYELKYKNDAELLDDLSKNEAVLTYFFNDNAIWGVVFKNDSKHLYKIKDDTYKINFSQSQLLYSLENDTNFNFEHSHYLWKQIFQPIEKFLTNVESVYLYKADNFKVPFSLLTRKHLSNLNYENNLANADWLIKHFAFANIYPFNKQKQIDDYDEKFLGIANSNSYDWVGLPSLITAEDEVIKLALSSNAKRENILIGNDSTKQNLIEKLNRSYQRIVIATHAVPSGWKGFTNEAALILSSESNEFFLTASEIAQLEISADMVVLSACSGITDDFRNLFKSFLVSGSNSVLYTNWQLESNFSAAFTDEFFKQIWLNNNVPKHIALKTATLRFIESYSESKYSDPAFWGNFSIGYSNL